MFFAHSASICMLSRCLLAKVLHRSSIGSLLRVRCWLGARRTQQVQQVMEWWQYLFFFFLFFSSSSSSTVEWSPLMTSRKNGALSSYDASFPTCRQRGPAEGSPLLMLIKFQKWHGLLSTNYRAVPTVKSPGKISSQTFPLWYFPPPQYHHHYFPF